MLKVLYEKKGGTSLIVTVNRPKVLDALDAPTWAGILNGVQEIAKTTIAVRGVS